METLNKEIKDRQMGCLYGLAVGDALGAAVEFKLPGTFPLVKGYRGNGPHKLNPGEWTDDTSMALALADSLACGFDLDDQALAYLSWREKGLFSVNGRCFDVGSVTRQALHRVSMGVSAYQSGSKDPQAAGNGSIMRLAPIAIKYWKDPKLEMYAELSSIPTHACKQCKGACAWLGVVLGKLISGESKQAALGTQLPGLDPAIQNVVSGSYLKGDVEGRGWVVASLEAALWAFSSSTSFKGCVLKAVNLGRDADTTGAVAGQLAGAYYGKSGIPARLKRGLQKKDMLEKALKSLGV